MYELVATIGMIFFFDGEPLSQTSSIIYESRAECIAQHIEGDDWFQANFPNYAGFACITGPIPEGDLL